MNFNRTATIYVIVGTLLFCPYICFIQAGAIQGTSCCVRDNRVSDCCCPSPASEPGKDRPSNPETEGGTCLCHGAVLQSPTTLPSLDIMPTVFLPSDDLLSTAKSSSVLGDDLFAVEHAVCHFPAADSGREVRALIESLLL